MQAIFIKMKFEHFFCKTITLKTMANMLKIVTTIERNRRRLFWSRTQDAFLKI